jgi:hypothetical protein
LLCLALVCLLTPHAEAYQSFRTSIVPFQGIQIQKESIIDEFDGTILTIIIGDILEIDAISAPDIDPLFRFSPEIDFSFGLTTDDAAPIEVTALAAAGIAVLDETAFGDVDESLLDVLDFSARAASVDSDDLLALRLDDERIVLLEHVRILPDATIDVTFWLPETHEIPEPGMLTLVGAGMLGLIGYITRQHLT